MLLSVSCLAESRSRRGISAVTLSGTSNTPFGPSYRFDDPDAIAVIGTHVWVADSRSNSDRAVSRNELNSMSAPRPRPGLPPGSRAALVVATGTYTDRALPDLQATARDAEQIAAVLRDPAIGAFDVTPVIDRGVHETKMAAEDFLTGRGPSDLVLVYLSYDGILVSGPWRSAILLVAGDKSGKWKRWYAKAIPHAETAL